MADVVISYARENDATVRQLADAVAREGYEVWRDESPAPNAASADAIAEQIGRAKAVIVVWSEAASASEWVRAEANVARGMKKLVQASADDYPPPIPFDQAQVAPISTWLGEPDHPGWQQIKAGLTALCGAPASEKTVLAASLPPAPPPAPPESAAQAAAPPAPAPQPPVAAPISAPPPPAPASASSSGRGKGALVAVLALVLLGAAAAAGWWVWQGGLGGGGSVDNALTAQLPGVENQATPAPAAPAPVQTAEIAPPPALDGNDIAPAEAEQFAQEYVIRGTSGSELVRSAPDGAGLAVARVAPGEVFTSYGQEGDWWRVRTAGGVVGYMAASGIRSRADAQAAARATEERRRRPTGPRINRANSENMRLFCQNAGRGTPQCRRFTQQVRNQQR